MGKNVKILLTLCFLCCLALPLFSSSGKIDSLLKVLEKSEGIEEANLKSQIGKEYIAIESFPKSISYSQGALTYFVSNEMNDEMIDCYRNIGNAYLELSVFDLALENYKHALDVSKKIRNEEQIAMSYHNLGTAYLTMDKYEKALNEYFLEALPIFKKLGNKKETARCLNNIGIILGSLGNIDSSLVYFERCLLMTREVGDSIMIGAVTSNIGYAHLQMGKPNKAAIYFREALRISTLINEKSGIANASINLARVFKENNDYDSTITYTSNALGFANMTRSRDLIQDCYKLLSDAYHAKGNDKLSLKYFKMYTAIHDSIYNEKSGKQLANMMALYEHEKGEQKIKELNAVKKMQDEKIKTQTNWLITSIFVLIIVILISVYIIRQNKKITLANKDLVRKSLELIQAENVSKISTGFKTLQQGSPKVKPVKYAGSAISLEQKDQILSDILDAFENKKIYIDHDITLGKLANDIGTNKSYISQVINERFNKNFSSFINEYRIKEAIRLLSENGNRLLTIEGISQTVGFKSKSAFNNAFKKYTGVTPSFFEKSSKDFNPILPN